MKDHKEHIAVIGAGIVGSSVAFHLARRGAHVTLIDADEPGRATTAVSFAWMNARDKDPRHYHDLNRRSLDMWPRFVERLGVPQSATWGGELRWATTDEGAREIVERVGVLQSWGYGIRLLDGEALHRLEPLLESGAVTAASYTDVDGHVETGEIVEACVKQLRLFGAEVLAHTRVVDLRVVGDQVNAVVTDQGEVACDAVVIAGGPDTTALSELASVAVPTYYTFGCTVITEPVAPVFETVSVVHSPRDCPPQTNFRQLPDGSLMLHGGAHGRVFDGGSLGQNDAEVKAVVDAVARFLPMVEGVPVCEVRRGRRPIPKDGLPIVGFTKHISNLYLSVMHSGVTLAPLIGECAAIEILDGVLVDFLARYRLERF